MEKNAQIKRMLEILDETIAYYSADVTRRAYDTEQQRCRYFIPEGGQMCAVGRCLEHPEELAKSDVGAWAIEGLNLRLKPEYRELSIGFWCRLQSLHDTSIFWQLGIGLTERGKEEVKTLRAEIEADPYYLANFPF